MAHIRKDIEETKTEVWDVQKVQNVRWCPLRSNEYSLFHHCDAISYSVCSLALLLYVQGWLRFWKRSKILWSNLKMVKFYFHVLVHFYGMETFCGQWLLVDTFFQNGWILVNIFRGWIFMDIFLEFSWTKNSSPWQSYISQVL